MEFYSQDIKNAREQEKEEQKRLFIKTVDNKPTSEEWFFDDEFCSENITVY